MKTKGKDVPKANAEGDKLPEEKGRKSAPDEMNQGKHVHSKGDVPKATAEGDKLPEMDGKPKKKK